MPHVFFVSRKWPPAIGGMETYAWELASALATQCKLDTFVLPGRREGKPPRLPAVALFILRAAWHIARRKVDVVHIGDLVLWPLAWVARLTGAAPRVVLTAYGLDVIYGRRPGLLPWCYRHYLRLGVRLIGAHAGVIAISNPTAQLCREAGFADVQVVTLGVHLPPGDPTVRATPVEPFLLFVGRLVRRKGASWFAREVLPLLPDSLRLIVVGKAWDAEELTILSQDKRIEYREYVSQADLLDLRRRAVAVIMPNIPTDGLDVEGFGLTAVEAAADGGVLLATGIEGLVDAVVDGQSGFLLPAQDPQAWAARIMEIRAWTPEYRASFIAHARQTIADRYVWPVVARNTLRAYLARD